MVVDDNRVNLILIKEFLHEYREVRTFQSAEKALKHLKEHTADLVITDLMMPEMDGIELLRDINQCKPEIPVIFLSANDNPDKIKEAFNQGAEDYLLKPISFNRLINVIKRTLSDIAL